MAAGEMRKRVNFFAPNSTTDAYGNASSGFETTAYLTVWGGFRPERGRERLEAGRLEASVAGTLKIRSSSESRAISAHDKAVIDGESYQIRSIVCPDQRDRFLEIVVERNVAI